MSSPLTRSLLALFLCACFAPRADAQLLDNTWFKVRVSVAGTTVSPEPELETGKLKAKGEFYVSITSGLGGGDDGSTPYSFSVISELPDGNFVVSDSGMLATLGEGEQLMVGSELGDGAGGVRWSMRLPKHEDLFLQLLFMAKLKIKLNAKDELKSARFKSFTGSVPFGVNGLGDGQSSFFGNARLSGKLVAAEDLPFEV